MALPPTLTAFLRDNSITVLGALVLVNILLLLGFIGMLARVGRMTRLYARLTRGTSGRNLEEILHGYMVTVTDVTRRMEALEGEAKRLNAIQQRCLQKVGMVRFDAFDEVGGEQSFALAVIDAQRSGMVLSSVYSRADVRIYAKAVHDGKPTHPLTQEEQGALAQAEER